MKCSHTFNLLDARGAISVTERAAYIGRVRTLARLVAQAYYDSRERLGFPMLKPPQPAAEGKMQDALLIELLTEELPPKSLQALAEAFGRAPARAAEGRWTGRSQAAGTRRSRRRAGSRCWWRRSPAKRTDKPITLSGPPVSAALDKQGKPTPALLGFAKKCGVSPEQLRRAPGEKGEVFVCDKVSPGAKLRDGSRAARRRSCAQAADSQGHALGRQRYRVRAPGARLDHAARSASRAWRRCSACERQRYARTSISGARVKCAFRQRATTHDVLRIARHGDRLIRHARGAHSRAAARSRRRRQPRRLRDAAARRSDRAGRKPDGL